MPVAAVGIASACMLIGGAIVLPPAAVAALAFTGGATVPMAVLLNGASPKAPNCVEVGAKASAVGTDKGAAEGAVKGAVLDACTGADASGILANSAVRAASRAVFVVTSAIGAGVPEIAPVNLSN